MFEHGSSWRTVRNGASVVFLDGRQTGSRHPRGTPTVSGAREGRAQLGAVWLHHAAAVILVFFASFAFQNLPAAQFSVSKLLV